MLRTIIFVSFFALILACGCTPKEAVVVSPEEALTDPLVARAQELLGMLKGERYRDFVQSFREDLRGRIQEKGIADAWEAVRGNFGNLEGVVGIRKERKGENTVVVLQCKFEKGYLDLRFTFDKNRELIGFFLAPGTGAHWEKPPYADERKFVEREVKVGPLGLDGVLTVPKGKGPFPAVVLVHGSGPLDRDETIGPNKPFKDIAWGLATRGIIVLRYDKRPLDMYADKAFTPEDEEIQDALSAIKLLQETPKVNKERVFVLGHSLGGMLAPEIAKRAGDVAGVIIMAGPSRNLADVIVDQVEYLVSLDGKVTEEERKKLAEVREGARKVKSGEIKKLPLNSRVLGFPVSYWLFLEEYSPTEVTMSLSCPILLLFGGRDYQVTEKDMEGWKKALSGKRNVIVRLYPALNHLFIAGEGKSSPAEYLSPGHVAPEVIDEIANFILSKGSR